MHQPLLGFLEHVGRVLLGFFLVLGIFVTFVTAAYTFVQDSGASGYEVTGWAVICAPLVFPWQIVKALIRVQAKVKRGLHQVSSFCRSSHVIKIIVAVLYTLLYVVFIASLLLFGVILLLSLDGRIVQSFSAGVPLYEIACIASLILTRGSSAQRLAFVICVLFVLQLLPGVSAMDGAGATASESGSANGPSLWSTAGAFVCYICRHACQTNVTLRQHVRSHVNVGHRSRVRKRQKEAHRDDPDIVEPGGGTGPRPTHDQQGRLLLGTEFVRNDYCEECKTGGSLVECDYCNLAYHFTCAGLTAVPDGNFFCPACEAAEEAGADIGTHETGDALVRSYTPVGGYGHRRLGRRYLSEADQTSCVVPLSAVIAHAHLVPDPADNGKFYAMCPSSTRLYSPQRRTVTPGTGWNLQN